MPEELTTEQQPNWRRRRLRQNLAVGLGFLTLEGATVAIDIITDFNLPAVCHALLITCGVGLTLASAIDLLNPNLSPQNQSVAGQN